MKPFKANNKVVWILSFAIFSLLNAAAYPLGYGPYETNKAPASVALNKCDLIQKAGKGDDGVAGMLLVYRDKNHPQWNVKLMGTTNYWKISLLDEQGKNCIIGTATNSMGGSFVEVYSTDLNGDKQPDYVVNVESGGCGLAAELSEATFILSTERGYRARSFEMWDFGRQDIISVNRQKYMISTKFIYGDTELARDKRNHNYWFYQLLKFDGDQILPANRELTGFPKWVWYSNKDNHKETDLLTAEQKQRLLNKN